MGAQGQMSKLFQIHEDDLADLERLLPSVFESASWDGGAGPALRTSIRRVQTILSNVRWNYQPHTEVERVDP
jgi:hypothetical protein